MNNWDRWLIAFCLIMLSFNSWLDYQNHKPQRVILMEQGAIRIDTKGVEKDPMVSFFAISPLPLDTISHSAGGATLEFSVIRELQNFAAKYLDEDGNPNNEFLIELLHKGG